MQDSRDGADDKVENNFGVPGPCTTALLIGKRSLELVLLAPDTSNVPRRLCHPGSVDSHFHISRISIPTSMTCGTRGILDSPSSP